MRRGLAVTGSVVALLVVGYVGYVAAASVLPFGGDSEQTTVIVTKETACSATETTSDGGVSGVISPSNSGCAEIEIGLDGTCIVDFPVDDEVRRAFAGYCPNGIRER